MSSTTKYEPLNRDPPYIPNAEIYETHRPSEWIAITDTMYSDVVNAAYLEGYRLSFVALDTGVMWIHIETKWQRLDTGVDRSGGDDDA